MSTEQSQPLRSDYPEVTYAMTWRRDLTFHDLAANPNETVCGRTAHYMIALSRADRIEKAMRPCPRCFPA